MKSEIHRFLRGKGSLHSPLLKSLLFEEVVLEVTVMNPANDLIDDIQVELNDGNELENHLIVPPLSNLSRLLDNEAALVTESNDINFFRESIMFLEVVGVSGLQPPGQQEDCNVYLNSALITHDCIFHAL